MLTEPTLEKLKALRLDAFAAAWLAQQQDPALAAVPFDERRLEERRLICSDTGESLVLWFDVTSAR